MTAKFSNDIEAAIMASAREAIEGVSAAIFLDAARYRWLRDEGVPELCVVENADQPLYGSELDRRIDRAMASSRSQTPSAAVDAYLKTTKEPK